MILIVAQTQSEVEVGPITYIGSIWNIYIVLPFRKSLTALSVQGEDNSKVNQMCMYSFKPELSLCTDIYNNVVVKKRLLLQETKNVSQI